MGTNKLNGQTAIITGATSGMGRSIARKLADSGARIIISGRNEARGNSVADGINSTGGSALFVQGDVSMPETNRMLVETAVRKYGRLDIAVMSAGELGIGSITDVSIDLWQKTINTNLNAVFYLLHYAIPEMEKTGSGRIVVIGSIAAYKVFPNHPAYCSSKGALLQLVKQAALDYGPNIRINMICPGQVDTPLLRKSVKAFNNPEEIIRETENKLPLKRLGKPEDIANAAVFLLSDDASWITGSSFVVDGGSLCIP